ncbi:DUF3159 domain-containing protein [Streptomyces sp. NPDC020742]|uniref:DUF3159 domain-containing protein n=1 Tax=unclassified Streptomyces TaxID=2593676 RepID=UPI0033C0B939
MDPAAHGDGDAEEALRAAFRQRLRSTVIDVAPVLGFTLAFAVTHRLEVALGLALAAGAGICVYRAVRRDSVRRTLAALALVCVAGLLAAHTGEAADFFLPGLVVHCVLAVVTGVLLLLGWPPLGLVAGWLTKEGTGWRRCGVRRRAFTKGHLTIYVGQLLMLAVQLPLYLSGQAVALGAVDALGPVVLTVGVLLGWRVYRRSLGAHRCPAPAHREAEASPVLERTR